MKIALASLVLFLPFVLSSSSIRGAAEPGDAANYRDLIATSCTGETKTANYKIDITNVPEAKGANEVIQKVVWNSGYVDPDTGFAWNAFAVMCPEGRMALTTTRGDGAVRRLPTYYGGGGGCSWCPPKNGGGNRELLSLGTSASNVAAFTNDGVGESMELELKQDIDVALRQYLQVKADVTVDVTGVEGLPKLC